MDTRQDSHHQQLLDLNAEYIRSVQESDVATFARLLAPDFACTHPDASFVNREEFLRQVAAPASISGLQARDVVVRIEGPVAVIHARTEYRKADGTPASGRYTESGRCVAADGSASLRTSRAAETRLLRSR